MFGITERRDFSYKIQQKTNAESYKIQFSSLLSSLELELHSVHVLHMYRLLCFCIFIFIYIYMYILYIFICMYLYRQSCVFTEDSTNVNLIVSRLRSAIRSL